MHIGKTHDSLTCTDLYIDGWKEKAVKSVETNKVKIEDTYEGETLVQLSDKEKYFR